MIYGIIIIRVNELKCPVCGSTNLLIEGKCVTCLDCFWSKCNI